MMKLFTYIEGVNKVFMRLSLLDDLRYNLALEALSKIGDKECSFESFEVKECHSLL